MTAGKVLLLPKMEKALAQVGENIKLGRLKRKLTTEQIAARANISQADPLEY